MLNAVHKFQEKIIHLGLGAFHRAHQAVVLQRLAEITPHDVGICAINLRHNQALVLALAAQDFRYHVLEKYNDIANVYPVTTIVNALHLVRDGLTAVIEKLCEPQVTMVTLTVTEKGYCVTIDHQLDMKHPDIMHDLANPMQPRSVIGLLYLSLMMRRKRALPAITIVSCDNMSHNGIVLKNAILAYADLCDPSMTIWIEQQISFPCTMVDRIVPAATPAALAELAVYLGQTDPCGLVTEPFLQWIIEDQFVSQRPAWEQVKGVQMVNAVAPFEAMKLSMLNGAHSFLAYAGLLAGKVTVAECMQDRVLSEACRQFMLFSQAPTVDITGVDLAEYAEQLIARFSNQSLQHRIAQIAMDGSQKIPQRWLTSLRFQLSNNDVHPLMIMAIAAWIYYLNDAVKHEKYSLIQDPRQTELIELCLVEDVTAKIQGFLSFAPIFSTDLACPTLITEIIKGYEQIQQYGVVTALAIYVNQ